VVPVSRADGDPFGDVAALLSRSVLAKALARIIGVLRHASEGSGALAAGREIRARYRAAPARDRIRLAGIGCVAFAVTYLLLMLIVPRRVAPLYPAAVAAVAGAIGVVCIVAADAVAAALRVRRHRFPQNNQP
jgi:hypothetical protein